MPDFRAEERTFQLLTQVSGRAGRGEVPGEVYVQTYTPFNNAIQCAINHDFSGFYGSEMALREELGYPPTGHLTAVHFRGEAECEVSAEAEKFMAEMKPALDPSVVHSGPNPSAIAKVKGKYRYVCLFRGNLSKRFRDMLREKILGRKYSAKVEVYADVDAISLM